MGLFGMLKGGNINDGVEECRNTPGAVLIDVRNPDEYQGGHIPDSINVPLGRIQEIDDVTDGYDTPLFIYCLSGARSMQAEAVLKQMGYETIRNIGGINKYKGPLE